MKFTFRKNGLLMSSTRVLFNFGFSHLVAALALDISNDSRYYKGKFPPLILAYNYNRRKVFNLVKDKLHSSGIEWLDEDVIEEIHKEELVCRVADARIRVLFPELIDEELLF